MAVGVPTRDYRKKSMGKWRNTLEIDFLGQFDFRDQQLFARRVQAKEGKQGQREVKTVSSEETF